MAVLAALAEKRNIMYEDKATLTIKELSQYLNIGMTKARELIKDKNNGFGYQIGTKWYANKMLLDKWVQKQCRR